MQWVCMVAIWAAIPKSASLATPWDEIEGRWIRITPWDEIEGRWIRISGTGRSRVSVRVKVGSL